MPIPFYWVDAFTESPFKGNPAGVCFLEEPAEDEWMRLLVDEMSLSEIAYLLPKGDGYDLRWFTPTVEAELCGHATLSASHVIWETGRQAKDKPIQFETRFSGTLEAVSTEDGIALDFPENPAAECPVPDELADILGPILWSGEARRDLLVVLPSAEAVRNFQPPMEELNRILESCLLITARSDDPEYDIISRFFAPRFGVPEDPVTGSAYCVLGPYWAPKLGKTKLRAYQASKRGGIVGVDVGAKPGRVMLMGHAIILFEGHLRV